MSSPHTASASPSQSTTTQSQSHPTGNAPSIPPPTTRSLSTSSLTHSIRQIAPSPATSYKSLLAPTNNSTGTEDPISAARRVLGVLQGERDSRTGSREEGGGLLGEIERAVEVCFEDAERVFEEDVDSARTVASIKHTLTLLSTLLSLLRSTPLGGIPLSPLPTSLAQDLEPTLLHQDVRTIQEKIEEKQRLVQRLFKDRQRVRESAEVVSGILSKVNVGVGAAVEGKEGM